MTTDSAFRWQNTVQNQYRPKVEEVSTRQEEDKLITRLHDRNSKLFDAEETIFQKPSLLFSRHLVCKQHLPVIWYFIEHL